MAKRKGITKTAISKLTKVVEALQTFATASTVASSESEGPLISVPPETYTFGSNGNGISFDLTFLTKGVGALTDASLHAFNVTEKVLFNGKKDSLVNIALGKDTELNGRILKVRTAIGTTKFTPIPSALDVAFVLKGGTTSKTISIPPTQFSSAGQAFVLDFTILLFKV